MKTLLFLTIMFYSTVFSTRPAGVSSIHSPETKNYPITRDTLNKYPDSLLLDGNLVDYTKGLSCGIFCSCGTLKLKLVVSPDFYPDKYAFVAIPCMSNLPIKFKSQKKWVLHKILMSDRSCCWSESPVNKFDTKGIPFYTIRDYEIQ